MGLWNLTFLKGGEGGGVVTRQIFSQNIVNHIVAMISRKGFRIVTQCCAASFSIKTLFVKPTTFSTA